MILFIDASALIAIIAEELEATALKARIDEAEDLRWSAMSCWEAISGLCSSYRMTVHAAREVVEGVAALGPFGLVEIGEEQRTVALDAYQRYGKSSGHKAKLNMGDCFAYACAKTSGATLLYKGDDFAKTDLA